MAPSLDTLPLETLLKIAEMCTWNILPSSTNPHPASYARSHAALVRTCRRLYEGLNRGLYMRNLKEDPLTASCLLWAVNVGNLDTVKRAHMYGAALDSSIEVTEKTTYCPPWGVIEPDPEDPLYHLPYQFSFIHVAILRKHLAIVQYLLENGADVHAPSLNFCCDDSSNSNFPLFPLHQCLFHDGVNGETSAVEWAPLEHKSSSLGNDSTSALINLLVSKGAYLLAEDCSALPKLSSEGYDDLAKQLLNRSDEVSLWAGLHFAASRNDLPLATDLIQRGADAEAYNYYGETALHFAAESCKNDNGLIRLLLRQPNVDPGARDSYDSTPLHFASGASNSEVVRLLLQQPSVSVNGATVHRETALHLACSRPHTDASLATVQHLIDAGALLNAVSRYSSTLLYAAVESEEFQIASTLMRAGSNPWQGDILSQWISMKPRSQTKFIQGVIKAGIDVEVILHLPIPGRHVVATPIYVAARKENTNCMEALFRGGARADSVVADLAQIPPALRNQRTLLSAVLDDILGDFTDFLISGPRISPEKEKTISLLIDNGARLGRVLDPSSSALQYAFLADQLGNPALLDLILKLSTTKNIGKQFLDAVIDNSTGGVANSRAKLLAFRERLFP